MCKVSQSNDILKVMGEYLYGRMAKPCFCRSLLLAGLLLSFFSSTASAQRAIPEDNLAYPVLITLETGGTGSGFFFSTGTNVYLVTAKHVLFDAAHKLLAGKLELLSYSKDPSDPSVNFIKIDLLASQIAGNLKAHPSEDVVVVRIGSLLKKDPPDTGYSVVVVKGVLEYNEKTRGGILAVGSEGIKPFGQVLAANEVIVFGYPTSIGLKDLPQIDNRRPLLRKGIVAGTNAQKHSIILDCPVYFGNSGGPVLEIDRIGGHVTLSIIGVISQYVPFTDTGRAFMLLSNSGYSVATPMDFVMELVK